MRTSDLFTGIAAAIIVLLRSSVAMILYSTWWWITAALGLKGTTHHDQAPAAMDRGLLAHIISHMIPVSYSSTGTPGVAPLDPTTVRTRPVGQQDCSVGAIRRTRTYKLCLANTTYYTQQHVTHTCILYLV